MLGWPRRRLIGICADVQPVLAVDRIA